MILNHRILGQGPPLIILHGLFGSLDNWMTVARQLATEYTLYLVDLRNHGQSFHDDQFDYESMSRDIERLVNHLNLENYSILGHSMGGKVAMFHAADNPVKVNKLIVVDIGPKYYPVHHRTILDGLISLHPETTSSRSDADQNLKQYVEEEPVRQFLLKNLKRSQGGYFKWKINLAVIDKQIENIGQALPESYIIRNETLFIKGGNSNYISESDIEQIRLQFPNSEITTIPSAGHWVHAQAPAELISTVLRFLK
ncbi:MAG: alpha/beta hydrolase [Cyclobacteriaceae bacterium]|nr:MAG: alpha/beta hydrolase [Cyclobacteriaceae bacterium]